MNWMFVAVAILQFGEREVMKCFLEMGFADFQSNILLE
jgi:hypothetical protein